MIPAYYGKWLFAGLFLVVLAGFFATMNSPLSIQLTGTEASDSLWSQANLLTHYQSVPARWAGTSIEALLLGHLGPTTPTLVTGILITGLLWAILAFVFARLFGHTVSVLQSRHAPWQFESRRTGIISHLFLASTNQSRRALITKEFFAFSRDATHTVQLIMLLTVCILYLYNFSRIEPPTRVGPDVLRVWDIFLILSNLILGSIVLLSICSRFVYPSISLEGNALWILQSAPISMRHIVRAKYFGWLIPTSVIAGVIFTSGGFALGLEPALVLTTTAAGVIICHGLVALGLGMGARFARFDWQHSAQITTNSGNLLYMLIGMILIGINTLPLTFIFGAYVLMPAIFHDDTATFILLCSGIGVLFIINFLAGYIALRFGTQALSTRHED
jgi:hypothetical protein